MRNSTTTSEKKHFCIDCKSEKVICENIVCINCFQSLESKDMLYGKQAHDRAEEQTFKECMENSQK